MAHSVMPRVWATQRITSDSVTWASSQLDLYPMLEWPKRPVASRFAQAEECRLTAWMLLLQIAGQGRWQNHQLTIYHPCNAKFKDLICFQVSCNDFRKRANVKPEQFCGPHGDVSSGGIDQPKASIILVASHSTFAARNQCFAMQPGALGTGKMFDTRYWFLKKGMSYQCQLSPSNVLCASKSSMESASSNSLVASKLRGDSASKSGWARALVGVVEVEATLESAPAVSWPKEPFSATAISFSASIVSSNFFSDAPWVAVYWFFTMSGILRWR